MKQYLAALQNIMDNGADRNDRTGVGTRSLFTQQIRVNLEDGFPAVTTKKLAWKAVTSELLWFIEGSSDERRLAEIRYGKDRSELTDKKTIWTDNAEAAYWKDKAKFEGDLGRVYGAQWRDWNKSTNIKWSEAEQIKQMPELRKQWEIMERDGFPHPGEDASEEQRSRWIVEIDRRVKKTFPSLNSVDQLGDVIQRIKDKPWDRRHIVIGYNPGEVDQQCLPPCHFSFQFYVAENKLSCHMNMRSADYPLGIPFNIASYAILTHMVAQVCNLGVAELIVTTGDSHIYKNQFEGVEEQLKRIPGKLPTLWLNPEIKCIDDFTMDDIKLENYNPQPTIKFPFAV